MKSAYTLERLQRDRRTGQAGYKIRGLAKSPTVRADTYPEARRLAVDAG